MATAQNVRWKMVTLKPEGEYDRTLLAIPAKSLLVPMSSFEEGWVDLTTRVAAGLLLR